MLTNEDVRHICTEVALGKGNHGSFLMVFCEAVIRADYENFQLLKPVAEQLIEKYKLHE